MQELLCSARPTRVVLQSPFADRVEKGKRLDKIGLSRAVRADQDVDATQCDPVEEGDAFEAFHRNEINRGRGHRSPLSAPGTIQTCRVPNALVQLGGLEPPAS